MENDWQRVQSMDMLLRLAKTHMVEECMNKHCHELPLWAVVSEGHGCKEPECQGDIAVLVCTTHKNELIETTEQGTTITAQRIDLLN